MIQYIIWDAGGTLFDTYPAMVSALEQTLAQWNHAVPRDEIETLLRISRRHAFDVLSVRLELNRDDLETRYRANYARTDASQQTLFDGVLDVCALIEQRGGGNFIITHRSRQSLQRLLDAHGLNEVFRDCITSDDAFPRKPDPTSILALMSKYELTVGDVLLVGDRSIDVVAGQCAGVQTCIFCPTVCDVPADLVISHYAELLDALRTEVAA